MEDDGLEGVAAGKKPRVAGLLTHEEIREAVEQVADVYSLRKAAYFGSYADGKATGDSDLDLLVELTVPSIGIWKLAELRLTLENMLNIAVDLIHAPLSPMSHIVINNTVVVYERE